MNNVHLVNPSDKVLEAYNLTKADRKKYQSDILKVSKAKADELGKELFDAITHGKRFDTICSLIKSGANVNYIDNERNLFPLYISLGVNSFLIFKTLLLAGANVNQSDIDGTTPLMVAALYGLKDAISILLALGANINAKDNHGDTALLLAKERGNFICIKVLIEKGASITVENNSGYNFFTLPTLSMLSNSKLDEYLNGFPELASDNYVDNFMKNAETVIQNNIRKRGNQ